MYEGIKKIEEVLGYIEKNITSDIECDKLAKMMNLSKFDAYIKKSLKNELLHCIRDMKREREKVVSFSNLTSSEEKALCIPDRYPSDKFEEKIETELFNVIIQNELLYEALKNLKPKSRNILLVI